MARIRSVKPEYWTSEQVMNMTRDARLLFIGLWTFCDDNGIHPASALSLKAEVLPGDTLTADQVMVFIDEMIEQGLVEEYEADGRAFWRVTGWRRHQRIDQPTFRHPTGDTRGDTGDAGDTKGDRVTGVTYKRLGGKQRQIVLRKLRERDGDACHLCGDTANLSILSLAPNGEENASDINSLRLICSTCKRGKKRGDAKNIVGDTHGDAQVIDGDSTTERSGEERSGDRKDRSSNSNIGDPGDVPPRAAPLPPREETPPSNDPAIAMGVMLRKLGVDATFTSPAVRDWVRRNVSTDVLLAAVAIARERKGDTAKIHPNYLLPIVEGVLNPPASTPNRPAQVSAPAPARKPRGTDPKGLDESYDDYNARVSAAEAARRREEAA